MGICACARGLAPGYLCRQIPPVPVRAPPGSPRAVPCALGQLVVSAGRGRWSPPVQRDLLQAAAGEGRLRRGHHGLVLSEQSWLSRAGWQRQDNMPWGAKLLGSPLKCFMRSDTYHLQSPACPRSRTTTALLLISLRSLCWLLNNKHRRGRCD